MMTMKKSFLPLFIQQHLFSEVIKENLGDTSELNPDTSKVPFNHIK